MRNAIAIGILLGIIIACTGTVTVVGRLEHCPDLEFLISDKNERCSG
jgi:hypothetical protein